MSTWTKKHELAYRRLLKKRLYNNHTAMDLYMLEKAAEERIRNGLHTADDQKQVEAFIKDADQLQRELGEIVSNCLGWVNIK